MTNFEKLKSNLTATWLSRSWNYRPNAIWINQFGLKIRKLRALENWKRPQTREVVRDGNPADQEVVRDGNMPTKRSYELETCRPRGRTNRKPADQEVVRIENLPTSMSREVGRVKNSDDQEVVRAGDSDDLEVVRIRKFSDLGRDHSWELGTARARTARARNSKSSNGKSSE